MGTDGQIPPAVVQELAGNAHGNLARVSELLVQETRHAPGAHGIPLVEFAKAGGEAAREVVAYLEGQPG